MLVDVLDVNREISSLRKSIYQIVEDFIRNLKILVDPAVMKFNFQSMSFWIIADGFDIRGRHALAVQSSPHFSDAGIQAIVGSIA